MNPKTINHEVPILVALALAAIAIFLAYRKRRHLEAWVDSVGKFFSPVPRPNSNPNWSLFWVSFVALFVEIMMIRWIGTEVRVFAYFQNLALIACFLGFGLGCYWSRRHKSTIFSLLAIVSLVSLVEVRMQAWQKFLTALSTLLSLSSDAAMWGNHEGG